MFDFELQVFGACTKTQICAAHRNHQHNKSTKTSNCTKSLRGGEMREGNKHKPPHTINRNVKSLRASIYTTGHNHLSYISSKEQLPNTAKPTTHHSNNTSTITIISKVKLQGSGRHSDISKQAAFNQKSINKKQS